MARDDEFDDLPMDDFESDFDDLDFGSPDVGGRKPASPTKVMATGALKGVGTSIPKSMATSISYSLPETSRTMREISDAASNFTNAKDELMREMQPLSNSIKTTTRRMLPAISKAIPKALHEKLNEWSKIEDEKRTSLEDEKAKAQAETIGNAIGNIFSKQAAVEREKIKNDQGERLIDLQLSGKQHEETMDVASMAANAQRKTFTFFDTTFTAYLKKDIELSYARLFALKDLVGLSAAQAKLLEVKLEEIKNNTALPEIQKQRLTEGFKQGLREQFTGKMIARTKDIGSSFFKDAFDNAKNYIRDGLTEGIQMATGMVDSAMDANDMMSDMPGAADMKNEMKGNALGGFIGNILGTGLGSKITSQFAPYMKEIESYTSGGKDKALMAINKWRLDNMDDFGIKGMLARVLPAYGEGVGVTTRSEDSALDPTPFDMATRTSIVDTIPGYLSRIEKWTHSLVTGREEESQIYDYKTRQFMSDSEFGDVTRRRFFGRKEDRARIYGAAVGTLRAGYVANEEGGDLKDFDAYAKDIAIFITNHVDSMLQFSPKKIHAFIETGERTRYIDKAFSGIDNFEQVAKIIDAACFKDGNYDRHVISDIDRQIYGLLDYDYYKELLPVYMTQLGYGDALGRYLSDEEYGIADRDYISKQIMDLDQESFQKEVMMSSRNFLDDLQTHEEKIQNILHGDNKFAKAVIGLTEKHRIQRDLTDENLDKLRNEEDIELGNVERNRGGATKQLIAGSGSISSSLEAITDTIIDALRTSGGEMNQQVLQEFMEYVKESDTILFGKLDHIIESREKDSIVFDEVPVFKGIHSDTSAILEVIKKNHIEMFSQIKTSNNIQGITMDAILSVFTSGKTIKIPGVKSWKTKILDKGEGLIDRLGSKLSSASEFMMNQTKESIKLATGVISSTYEGSKSVLKDLYGFGKDFTNFSTQHMFKVFDKLKGLKKKYVDDPEAFRDIYTTDSLENKMPKITLSMFRNGIFDIDGNPILKMSDIKGPLYDKEGNLILSLEEFKMGIFDKNGIKISELKDKMTNKIKGLGIGSKLKKLIGKIPGITGSFTEIITKAMEISHSMASQLMDTTKNVFKSLFGEKVSKESLKDTNSILKEILAVVKSIDAKQSGGVFGDTDGDGIRENSYEDKMRDKQARKASRESGKGRSGRAGSRISSRMQALGLAGSAATAAGVAANVNGNDTTDSKDGSDNNEGGMLDTAGGTALGAAAAWGGKALLGAAGTYIASAGGAGALLSSAGTGAAALLFNPVTLGIVAVGATALAGYALYKYLDYDDDNDFWKTKCQHYGFPNTELVQKMLGLDIRDLEEETLEVLKKESNPLGKGRIEEYAASFGFDHDNTKQMEYFVTWYQKRFVPVYMCYLNSIHAILPSGTDLAIDPEDIPAEYKPYILKHMKQQVSALPREDMALVPTVKSFEILEKRKAHDKMAQTAKGTFAGASSKTYMEKETDDLKRAARHTSQGGRDSIAQGEENLKRLTAQQEKDRIAQGYGDSSKYYSTGASAAIMSGFSASDVYGDHSDIDESVLMEKTKQWIKGHEGLRLENYGDSLGHATIGYGHLNDGTNGQVLQRITKEQADMLFERDFYKHVQEAQNIPEWANLDPVRRAALINLTFNMGYGKFMKFTGTRNALINKDWRRVYNGIMNSKYASQVGSRAREVANTLSTGDPKFIRPKAINTGTGKALAQAQLPPVRIPKSALQTPESVKANIPQSTTTSSIATVAANTVSNPSLTDPNKTTDTVTSFKDPSYQYQQDSMQLRAAQLEQLTIMTNTLTAAFKDPEQFAKMQKAMEETAAANKEVAQAVLDSSGETNIHVAQDGTVTAEKNTYSTQVSMRKKNSVIGA